MEQKEIIEKIINKQNNLTSAQKMTFDGNALILSLNNKKNKIMLILSVVFIVLGLYFIYNYYAVTGQISRELWHWGLIALGGFAIFNRTKIANQKTIIDTQNKIIKQMVRNEVKNSIAFADASDFFIDSIKMRGGGFGIQSAVYVTNSKGKILLGVLDEKQESEEYIELLKVVFEN